MFMKRSFHALVALPKSSKRSISPALAQSDVGISREGKQSSTLPDKEVQARETTPPHTAVSGQSTTGRTAPTLKMPGKANYPTRRRSPTHAAAPPSNKQNASH